ncbi:MAG: hypothetical protein KJ666_12750 [Bacteroidetes bacterium]|nr:hypothetical protein [Bacteroidota bacterium]
MKGSRPPASPARLIVSREAGGSDQVRRAGVILIHRVVSREPSETASSLSISLPEFGSF